MQVVIAPDKFAGTLTAPEAARAIAEGWRRTAPGDVLIQVPMSDGGPGFVDAIHQSRGGELLACVVQGPYGDPTPATVLLADGAAWIESAQAIGLALVPETERDATRATSVGVGELLAHAVDAGATRIVVGLGGSGTNDGGAGLLAALGATADVPLTEGPAALTGITQLDLEPVRERLSGVELVAATDVDNPLLGIVGATKTYGPQKGLTDHQLLTVDGQLQELAVLADRKLADAKGAGAAGGVGYALMLAGATRESGVGVIADSVGLAAALDGADLVVTGEGAFDFSSRSGKVPYGVAELAVESLVPCIAMAGQVLVGSRETRALGLESAYSMVELIGRERSFAAPYDALADLAERVARTWSR